MFNFIKNKLKKIYSQFTSQLGALFGKSTINEATLKELEILLISSDTGVKTTRSIIEELRARIKNGTVQKGTDLKVALQGILLNALQQTPYKQHEDEQVFLLVGINGSGKTTFIGKLAHYHASKGKRVLLVAADTFRAAAPEQLTQWAKLSNTDIVVGKENQDPASVVFAGIERFKKEHYDILIVDTAGRLHVKVNLMNELTKIKRVITKQLPDKHINTLLTVDSMLGQNSFEQAKIFKENTNVDGIVLTKMDGTGKGGIVFAISQELQIPVAYITFGEKIDQFKMFDAQEYIKELLSAN